MFSEYGFFLLRFVTKIVVHRFLRTDLERELFIARKENEILKRKVGRVTVTPFDRAFYVGICSASRKLIRRAIVIQPETVIAWHRKLVAKKWDSFGQVRRGRPRITDEVRRMVIEMKKANPQWGSNRIAMEMNKFRLQVCKKSVATILLEHGFDPTRSCGSGWFQFMKTQASFACDYFEVETLSLQRLNVFFMMDIKTRAIVDFAVTQDRSQEWVRNRMRSIFSFLDGAPPTVLVCDRDTSFGGTLKEFLLDSYGIKLLKTPRRMPVFNCFAERMVKTFRSELTDRVLFYGQRDLSRALAEYVGYYNYSRVHSSLGCRAPKRDHCTESSIPSKGSRIRKRCILRGLITDFELAA